MGLGSRIRISTIRGWHGMSLIPYNGISWNTRHLDFYLDVPVNGITWMQRRYWCQSYSSDEESDLEEEELIEKPTIIKPTKFPRGSETAETWSFIEDYRNNGEVPPIDLYHKVLQSYIYKEWIKRFYLVLDQMEEIGPIPDVTCYNMIMKWHLDHNEPDKLEKILERMQDRFVKMNLQTFDILFALAAKSEDLDLMEGLLPYITEDTFPMNRSIYHNCVSVYVSCNKLNNAFSFIREQAQKRIVPNIETCNMILAKYMEDEKLSDAQRVFDLMTEFNLHANHRTYELTMLGYVATGNYEEVDRLFYEMGEDLPYKSQAAYSIMMQKCYKQKNVAKGMDYFEEIVKEGDPIEEEIYTIAIVGLCENEEIDLAKAMFMKMLEDEIPFSLEIVEVLLESYMKNKYFSDAQSLLELAASNELDLQASTFEIIIDGAMEHKIYDQALFWMEQLRKLEPNYSPTKEFYDDIIKGSLEEQGIRLTVEDIMERLSIFSSPITTDEAKNLVTYEAEEEQRNANIRNKIAIAQNVPPPPSLWKLFRIASQRYTPAKRYNFRKE